jgi:hypothetical protein
MKDPIVQEIHRHRAAYAKRFNYDVQAIGEDIRRCETESGGKFAATITRRKRSIETKRGKKWPARKIGKSSRPLSTG